MSRQERDGPAPPVPRPRIGFATELRPSRREAWSGTNRNMLEALSGASAEVRVLPPILQGPTLLLNRASKALMRLTGVNPMLNRDPRLAALKARRLGREARRAGVDVLFAPASSALIARMPPGLPVAYASDATLRLLIGYYPDYTDLPRAVKRRAVALEAAAMRRADLLIYPSAWAARSAIDDYGIDPARVMVQPFGANLPDPPPRAEALAPRAPGALRLLFCGVDWRRKGGAVALGALRSLRSQGVPAELLILGCAPPPGESLPEGVEVIPFLDKAVPAERARFRRAFAEADVLLLPTEAECFGIVMCEAAAFGAVSVVADTGGTSATLRDGESGLLMPAGAGPEVYAAALRRLAEEPARLEAMRRAARADFEARLNWGAWAAAVLPRIEALAG